MGLTLSIFDRNPTFSGEFRLLEDIVFGEFCSNCVLVVLEASYCVSQTFGELVVGDSCSNFVLVVLEVSYCVSQTFAGLVVGNSCSNCVLVVLEVIVFCNLLEGMVVGNSCSNFMPVVLAVSYCVSQKFHFW